jgi:hypothetical protein
MKEHFNIVFASQKVDNEVAKIRKSYGFDVLNSGKASTSLVLCLPCRFGSGKAKFKLENANQVIVNWMKTG